MAVWLVRGGRSGERESAAVDKGLAIIGWSEMPDLSSISRREELDQLYRQVYPANKDGRRSNHVGQLWAFLHIQDGDLVVLPLKTRSAVAIGKAAGPYRHDPEFGHVRPVQWLRTDVPRTAFDQDLLFSLGAFMTVCRIERNHAEDRIRALLDGKPAPSRSAVGVVRAEVPTTEDADQMDQVDVAAVANDQISSFLVRKFKGHEMARLVEAILRAEGYRTFRSPPGADGGVDILAGGGPMGFSAPRICVQVKSQQTPIDVNVLRELRGTMQSFGAEHGLLVAWGGFRSTVHKEAKQTFFDVRLWDGGDLVSELLRNYDRLPDDLQAELPLKRVWALVEDDE